MEVIQRDLETQFFLYPQRKPFPSWAYNYLSMLNSGLGVFLQEVLGMMRLTARFELLGLGSGRMDLSLLDEMYRAQQLLYRPQFSRLAWFTMLPNFGNTTLHWKLTIRVWSSSPYSSIL
jgi:hypothetical protein